MRVRRLDDNKDMTFGDGGLNFFQDNIEGVAQNVYTNLALWAGEWFLDTTAGTYWLEKCLGKNTLDSAITEIRRAILSTSGVKEILSLNSSYDVNTREVSIQTNIDTLYGKTYVAFNKVI